jgi:hypothetical protein
MVSAVTSSRGQSLHLDFVWRPELRPPIAPGRSIGPGLTLGESRVRKPDASVSGSGRGGDRGRARIHTRLRPWQVATARSLWGCHLSARPLTSKTRDRLRGSQGLKSNGQRWNEVQPEWHRSNHSTACAACSARMAEELLVLGRCMEPASYCSQVRATAIDASIGRLLTHRPWPQATGGTTFVEQGSGWDELKSMVGWFIVREK